MKVKTTIIEHADGLILKERIGAGEMENPKHLSDFKHERLLAAVFVSVAPCNPVDTY
jgi:hypothetical protein